MNPKKFSGTQLKKARLLRGKTLTELSVQTEISKQSLSLYESNKNIPGYEKGIRLAKELQVPYSFFLQDDVYPTNTEVTYFRSLANTTKMARTTQSLKLEIVAQIYEILMDYVDFPQLNLPNIKFNGNDNDLDTEACIAEQEEIEHISLQVRQYWNLGIEPISNLQFVLEKEGIIITGFDTKTSNIDAFSQYTSINNQSNFLIAVDIGNKPEGRIHFDLAHELGHILLHPWSENLDMISKEEFKQRETQANMFAGAFLLPINSFKMDIQAYPTNLEYYLWLKKKWHVSIQAMLFRSRQLECISNNQYQYMMRIISKKGWRKKEPNDTPFYLNDNIFQAALDILFEEHILTPNSFVKLLEQNGLNLYTNDIEEILNLRPDTLKPINSNTPIIKLKHPQQEPKQG